MKCAPEIGASMVMAPKSTAPTAKAIIMRPTVESAPSEVAMWPAPVTVATMPAVPRNSAKYFWGWETIVIKDSFSLKLEAVYRQLSIRR